MLHASASAAAQTMHSTHILVQLVPLLASEMSQTPLESTRNELYQESATITSFRRRSRWMDEVREGVLTD
jgi:hypothetical protein